MILEDVGCSPEIDYEEYLWNRFGEDLRKNSVKNLKYLDSVLSIIQNSWGDSGNYPIELYFNEYKGIPSGSDIYSKFLSLWSDSAIKKQLNKASSDEQYKEGWNIVKDCRRVIDGILNDKPVYLIPEQVNTFKEFAKILSRPLEKKYYYF